MQIDLLDKAIAIAIMLFILSMIAERIITWVKLQFGKPGHSLLFFSTEDEDDSQRNEDPQKEKKRELKILGLNIVISVLISLLAGADFFAILGAAEPFKALGYPNPCSISVSIKELGAAALIYKVVGRIFGSVLTGLFISLGSKFWHDMLDMLFYTKNIKEKLVNPDTYNVKSIDELDEFIRFNENDLVNLAIAQHELVLKAKFHNIRFINDTVVIRQGKSTEVMAIFLTDNNSAGLPETVPVKLPSGKTYQVEVEIISNTGMARVSNGLTASLYNTIFPTAPGSGCCILKNGTEHFLLTNCHVLTGGFNRSPLFNVNDSVFYNDREIGLWHYGSISAVGDLATVKIDDIDRFLADNDHEQFNNQIYILSKPKDIKKRVSVRGSVTKLNTNAFIVDIVFDRVGVEYKDGSTQKFRQAIMIGDRPDLNSCLPPVDFGDSGGVVFDLDNRLIGIITAKDDKYAYATPIEQFIREFNFQIM
jgi:hypothetical protein